MALNLAPMNQINYTGNNNNNSFIDSNNININPIQFDLDLENISIPPSSRNRSFCKPSLKKKCLILMFLLFVITLGILIGFLILKTKNNDHLKDDLQEKDGLISKIRLENNSTMEEKNKMLLGKMERIQQLTKQLIESEKERSRMNND